MSVEVKDLGGVKQEYTAVQILDYFRAKFIEGQRAQDSWGNTDGR